MFSAQDFQPLSAPSRRPRTVSGASSTGQQMAHEPSDDDSIDTNVEDIEALCAPPEYSKSFGSAIAEALNNAAKVKNPRKSKQSAQTIVQATAGGNKKKKAQKMVLFSTGGSHTFDGK